MNRIAVIALLVVVPLVVLGWGAVYIVPEGQQVVITQFGKLVGEPITEAGLKFKLPLVQEVHYLEKRLLPWDGAPENMLTIKKTPIIIDVWARWRITDAKKFFQAVHTETGGYRILDELLDPNVLNVIAQNRLINVVRSTNRTMEIESEELAKETSKEVFTTGRAEIEAEILQKVNDLDLNEKYGMEVVVVRIKRVNYIEKNRNDIYRRMQSERMRIVELFQSEGEGEKSKILGDTRYQLDKIEGEREKQVAEIRGRADAEVIRIAAEAYSKSPEFYMFLRRLEAYKKSLGPGTQLILSTDNKFLKQFRDPGAESTGKKQ